MGKVNSLTGDSTRIIAQLVSAARRAEVYLTAHCSWSGTEAIEVRDGLRDALREVQRLEGANHGTS